ncbi:MAG: hypothetical protein ACT4P7_05135 [Gemmatimonadaceae bacterium]
MRLPVDWRPALERAFRLGALVIAGVLFWRVATPRVAAVVSVPHTRVLRTALTEATRARTPGIDLTLDSLPGAPERAWAQALARAGTRVRWRPLDSLPATALSIDPIAEPQGGVRIVVAAPGGSVVRLKDSIGVFDSTRIAGGGVRVVETITGSAIRLEARAGTAIATVVDSVALRPVLVLARAGWEGTFTAAALEEAGWRVETDFLVTGPAVSPAGPLTTVRTGDAMRPIDTTRFAAVVALDESARARAGAIAAFVRTGGGLVLGPGALAAPALASLSPAHLGQAFKGTLGSLAGNAPRAGLSGRRLQQVRADAVVLEQRGPSPIIVARRERLGRVLLVGYEDSWRWRLQGGANAIDEHRAWWSGGVGSVARPVLVARDHVDGADQAPYAALASLGPASANIGSALLPAQRWEPWLLGLCLVLLTSEWFSRRTRGAR